MSPRREARRTGRAFLATIVIGAAIWSLLVWAAFGATITVTQDGVTLCTYHVTPRYTAPETAPMPKERGK